MARSRCTRDHDTAAFSCWTEHLRHFEYSPGHLLVLQAEREKNQPGANEPWLSAAGSRASDSWCPAGWHRGLQAGKGFEPRWPSRWLAMERDGYGNAVPVFRRHKGFLSCAPHIPTMRDRDEQISVDLAPAS